MSRCCRALLVALVVLGVAAPSAGAAPPGALGDTLGAVWKTALEIPKPQNPFTPSDPANNLCADLGGGVVAPFAGTPKTAGTPIDFTCTVTAGTRIFIAAWSFECSSFPNDHGTFGTTEPELRKCARAADKGITATVTINGGEVPLSEVVSGLVQVSLPPNNIFGVHGAERNGQLVAHGFVFLTDPLTPGTYTIKGHVVFPTDPPSTIDFTTTIIVQ